MNKRTPQLLLTGLAALTLVGAAFTGTASATGKQDAPGQERKAEAAAAPAGDTGKGDKGGKAEAAAVTEDNDTNDGGTPNNVVDAGDNRHPSGKDRSVEHGGSGNQGKATSDPDDDGRGPDRSNGGADKPGGAGGVDKADQDGNNGCGNDDDFEDDNEGWCGRKPAPAKDEKPAPQPGTAEQGCPSGKVDMNGTEPGGCEKPKPATGGSSSCPSGTVDMNGSKAGGCETPKPATAGNSTPTPANAGSSSTPPATTGTTGNPGTPFTPQGDVLGASAAAPALPSACVLAAIAGTTPMPAGCVTPIAPAVRTGSVQASSAAPAVGEVLSAGLTTAAPASVQVSARSSAPAALFSAATGGVAGALAFTGVNIWTLLVAALLAIAAGLVIVRMDRRSA